MKTNFAICDDDIMFCKSINKIIREYFRTQGIRCQNIDIYHCGESLLASSKQYDIIFMDVEMPGLSGIHTGKRYRKKYPRTLFLLITAYDSYLDEAFKFHAFRYISKPVNKLRLFNNIKDAIIEYTSVNQQVLIETKENKITIYASDIIFIEASGKVAGHVKQKYSDKDKRKSNKHIKIGFALDYNSLDSIGFENVATDNSKMTKHEIYMRGLSFTNDNVVPFSDQEFIDYLAENQELLQILQAGEMMLNCIGDNSKRKRLKTSICEYIVEEVFVEKLKNEESWSALRAYAYYKNIMENV